MSAGGDEIASAAQRQLAHFQASEAGRRQSAPLLSTVLPVPAREVANGGRSYLG